MRHNICVRIDTCDVWYGRCRRIHEKGGCEEITVNLDVSKPCILTQRQQTHVDHFDILSLLSCTGGFLPVFPVQNCPPAKYTQIRSRLYHAHDCYIPILIQLDGDDNHFAGVHTNRGSSAIRLVALHAVNVDDPFFTVHLCDFSFPTLVCPPNDPDLVVLADG